MLLAGAERAPAIANWIMAAGILFGGGLHWYTIATRPSWSRSVIWL
jgi:hypothetical protein